MTFGGPVQIPPPAKKVNLDKNWTVCDNHPSSPFYGNCYTELDNFGDGDLELMSTSTDGGLTWSTPISTAGNDKGLGGQPVVQPSGSGRRALREPQGQIDVFRSDERRRLVDRAGSTVSTISFHPDSGGLRTSPLPSAEIDGDGNVYVAWEDCRFEPKCAANDIVLSTSTDGVSWSAVAAFRSMPSRRGRSLHPGPRRRSDDLRRRARTSR